MVRFVGREQEVGQLAGELERVRQSGTGRFVWLRGRRRVGKSRLVQEFCDRADVAYCFHQAREEPREGALRAFGETVSISGLPASDTFADATFGSWAAALAAAASGATSDQPLVIVLDEVPYLAASDPGFASDLQKAWDRTLERSPVLLVAVGSDVRMMDELVRARAPLFGRPTREMHIGPLDPAAVAEITGSADPIVSLDRYLIVGGFPLLAATWEPSMSSEAFLGVMLADDQSPLVTTAERVLASEFSAELQARKVIEAIGAGDSSYTRIQTRSGVKGNTLTGALDVLVGAKRLVEKAYPYAAPPGRTAAKYTITDPYLRFWLRFVGPNIAELARGQGALVRERIVRDWQGYRGRAIEPVVRAALERRLATDAFSARWGAARYVGSWWTRNHDIEVDLVGGDAPDPTRIGFVGTLKWRTAQPVTRRDVDHLAASRASVPGADNALLVAVSATGVAPDAGADLHVGPADILESWR